MSLDFPNTGDDVDHGTGVELTATHTLMMWLKLNSADSTNRQVGGSEAATGNHRMMNGTTTGGKTGIIRGFYAFDGGTGCDTESSVDWVTTGVWYCIVWTLSSAVSVLFKGTLTADIVQETSPSVQTTGVGSFRSANGKNFRVGNQGSGTGIPGNAEVAAAMLWPSTLLTIGQMQAMQFRFVPIVAGCELYTWYGFNGTGTQADWSGQSNNGTVDGADLANNAPLASPFAGSSGWQGDFTAAESSLIGGKLLDSLNMRRLVA